MRKINPPAKRIPLSVTPFGRDSSPQGEPEKQSLLPGGRWPKDGEGISEGILAALDILESLWHNEANPPELGHEEPLDGLIETVLSQNTNDRNRDLAFSRLTERFPGGSGPDWEAVSGTAAEELEDVIRPAGLAPTKARRILEILGIVRRDFGACSIAALAGWERDAVREYLVALPGVGAKTAACVLLFDLKMPAFPVDTHVGRVCRRLGFAPSRASAEEISLMLERLVPPARFLGAHVNMIEHGRAVCGARNPACPRCAVRGLCGFARGGE